MQLVLVRPWSALGTDCVCAAMPGFAVAAHCSWLLVARAASCGATGISPWRVAACVLPLPPPPLLLTRQITPVRVPLPQQAAAADAGDADERGPDPPEVVQAGQAAPPAGQQQQQQPPPAGQPGGTAGPSWDNLWGTGGDANAEAARKYVQDTMIPFLKAQWRQLRAQQREPEQQQQQLQGQHRQERRPRPAAMAGSPAGPSLLHRGLPRMAVAPADVPGPATAGPAPRLGMLPLIAAAPPPATALARPAQPQPPAIASPQAAARAPAEAQAGAGGRGQAAVGGAAPAAAPSTHAAGQAAQQQGQRALVTSAVQTTQGLELGAAQAAEEEEDVVMVAAGAAMSVAVQTSQTLLMPAQAAAPGAGTAGAEAAVAAPAAPPAAAGTTHMPGAERLPSAAAAAAGAAEAGEGPRQGEPGAQPAVPIDGGGAGRSGSSSSEAEEAAELLPAAAAPRLALQGGAPLALGQAILGRPDDGPEHVPAAVPRVMNLLDHAVGLTSMSGFVAAIYPPLALPMWPPAVPAPGFVPAVGAEEITQVPAGPDGLGLMLQELAKAHAAEPGRARAPRSSLQDAIADAAAEAARQAVVDPPPPPAAAAAEASTGSPALSFHTADNNDSGGKAAQGAEEQQAAQREVQGGGADSQAMLFMGGSGPGLDLFTQPQY